MRFIFLIQMLVMTYMVSVADDQATPDMKSLFTADTTSVQTSQSNPNTDRFSSQHQEDDHFKQLGAHRKGLNVEVSEDTNTDDCGYGQQSCYADPAPTIDMRDQSGNKWSPKSQKHINVQMNTH